MGAGLIAGTAGISPLFLYVLFGPKNGNPIGLGLLAAVTVPLAGGCLVLGFVKLCVDYVSRRQR